MTEAASLLSSLDGCVIIACQGRGDSRAALMEQYEKGPRYEVVHGRPCIEATKHEKLAVVEALRWAPVGIYGQLASFERTQPYLRSVMRQRYEALKAWLAGYPLTESALVRLFRAIRQNHWVVTIARGPEAERLRTITEPWLPAGVFPSSGYLLLGYGPWDGPHFQLAVGHLQQRGHDSAFPLALAVAESAHGRPWDDLKSRFMVFPKQYRSALVRAVGGALELRDRVAVAFLRVVASLRDRPLQKGRRPRGWGAWLPREAWPNVRLSSVVRHRVQAEVRDEFVLPKATVAGDVESIEAQSRDPEEYRTAREHPQGYDVGSPRRQRQLPQRDRRRGSPSYQQATSRLRMLSARQQREVGQQMRERLKAEDYSLFEVWLRRDKIAVWARQRSIDPARARQRLHRIVRPALLSVLEALQKE